MLELAVFRALLIVQFIRTERFLHIDPAAVRQGFDAVRHGLFKLGMEAIGTENMQRALIRHKGTVLLLDGVASFLSYCQPCI